jgi:hypothetical protein
VQVVIDNVAQNPSSAYTVSGSTITFTSAPLSGTNNIYVYYTSPITQVIAPSQGSVNTTSLGNITNIASGNSSLTLQTGSGNTTAVTVDTSQNVGIGGTPSYKLQVNATASADGVYITSSSVDGTPLYLNNSSASGRQFRLLSTGSGNGPGAGTLGVFDGTANAYRMIINSSGYVTTPYQPVFQAFRTSNVSSSNYVVYDSTWVNVGSCYDKTNGRFTAPVTGVYQLSYGGIGNSTIGVYRLSIYKNGSVYSLDGTQEAQARAETATSSTFPTANKTVFISLTANDYVQIYFIGITGMYGDNSGYVHFSGRLVG